MRTFYDVDGITIYHADCADVMPLVPPETVDLLLTDPPYGIGWVGPAVRGKTRGRYNGTRVHGDLDQFDPRSFLRYGRVAMWGADHFSSALPDGSWLVWDKTGGGKVKGALGLGHAELMWHNCGGPVKVYSHLWMGYNRASEHSTSYHPTQKPVSLMRWIVDRWTEPGDLVFDPFMGSGPIARACLDLGRRYVGVEIVEEYCQTAVDRLGQLALRL